MRIQVVTLFPEAFAPLVSLGVTGRGISNGKVSLELLNPRDYATDRHRTVDDRPYGGGPGMVMAVEPLRSTIRAAKSIAGSGSEPPKASLLSPQGRPLDQVKVKELARREELILVCGRYEGIDERLIERDVVRMAESSDVFFSVFTASFVRGGTITRIICGRASG